MHRTVTLRPSAVAVVCSIAILCSPVVARAQLVDGSFNPGANQVVDTLAVQPDGKIVVGGQFTGLGGASGTTPRSHIGRLNPDGTVDPSFVASANGRVFAVAVQPDGKIVVGGLFTSLGVGAGAVTRNRIGRLNADGSVDPTFNPGANESVFALTLQPDGKILVGGKFSTMGGGSPGTTRIGLARLNPNGSPDSFNPGASKLPSPGAPPEIYSIVLQPDGKIVVGGYFNGLGGGTGATTRNFIGRLLADGTVDSFNPGVTSITGVNALALQADGKIVVGGTFTQLGGSNRANIGRLDSNGLLDSGFNPGAETQVLTLGVQADGKILAGGYFKWLGDAGGSLKSVRNYIGRLNENGAVDTTFNPGASNVVNALALQADGAIVAGGIFDRLGGGGGAGIGTLRSYIGRITNDAATQTLTLTGGNTVLNWARGGAGPEVTYVTFESSTTGAIYAALGNGTRVTGGWQFSGLSLPTNVRAIRARGYYGTGFQNGSSSIVQSILTLGPPLNSHGDFDGDGKADITVFRPSSGTWYTLQSGGSTLSTVTFGISTDIPIPRDYDGDGKTDVAVYRPSTGTWYIFRSSAGILVTQFGVSTDVPVPADYDGDGKADIALYRPSDGTWFILGSTAGLSAFTWGTNTDVPVPGDYDGDGKADIAVYRPSGGTWFILQSANSAVSILSWGISTDVPVSGDYDGDGKTDVAVYRPSSGTWFILGSTAGFSSFAWGISTDVPVPADYDGDGKTDIAVYRPSSGTWYILQSSTSTLLATTWGISTDIPVFKRP